MNAGHIRPLQPWTPLQPGDEEKPNFCRYHQRVQHPTNRCRTIMEKIQQMLDDGEIQLKESPKRQAGAMVVSLVTKAFLN